MSLKIGESDLISASVGDLDIKSIWVGEDLVWQPPNYLCFTAQEAECYISMVSNGEPSLGQAFEYSRDKITWNTFSPDTTTITLESIGDKVYFRGDNVTISEDSWTYYHFRVHGLTAVSGNVMSLLDKKCQLTTISHNWCFYLLFVGCDITTPPELPATTLSEYCYTEMFDSCSYLTSAPALPATTLTHWCYCRMFRYCENLTSIPALPGVSIAGSETEEGCYDEMFMMCTSLQVWDASGSSHDKPWRIPTVGTIDGIKVGGAAALNSVPGERSSGAHIDIGTSGYVVYYTQNTPVS